MSYPGQFPSQFQPYQQPQKSGSSWALILGGLGGGALLLIVLCCGGLAIVFRTPSASAAAKVPFAFTDVSLPTFGERGEGLEFEPGVLRHTIPVGAQQGGYYTPPGHGGEMLLHLPQGQHAPRSLPCILITGAGTNLLSGVQLEGEGNPEEYTSYVRAGYAVLVYELDGPSDDTGEDIELMQKAFEAFRASRAGLVNARNAIEYVLAHAPEIDPNQLYAAGHSSAAAHALLFAAHEPRLAGVIAYAPAVDIPKWFSGRMWLTARLLPGSVDFITQSSPSTHRKRINCPTFLFQAEDDSVCDIAETRALAEQLTQQGTDTVFVSVPTGDHYDAMIDDGMAAAIKWLRERPAKK